jgi:Zn-dependent peptidase ImmA (M78 family)
MVAVKMPINPDILAWAMDQVGIDESALAEDLHLPANVIDKWLHGAEQPSTTELRSLAKALRRPSSVFFLPRPPGAVVSTASFRSPLGAKGKRQITREELDEIRQAARRQKIVDWIRRELEESDRPELPAAEHTAGQTAASARKWLNWSSALQFDATSKSAVTRLIRQALEDQGLMVLQLSMAVDSCRGFSLKHDRVPLIAVNTKGQISSARTFTMLHELGHLIRDEQAVCDEPQGPDERWCDNFAASFLLPADQLEKYLLSKNGHTDVADDDVETVRLISQEFKASYQSVALRLIKLKWANWPLYYLASKPGTEVEKGLATPPQITPIKRIREYGTTFTGSVLAARDASLISEADARKYLNVNGEQLLAIRHRLAGIG